MPQNRRSAPLDNPRRVNDPVPGTDTRTRPGYAYRALTMGTIEGDIMRGVLLMLAVTAITAAPVQASIENEKAVLALHTGPVGGQKACAETIIPADCDNWVVNNPSNGMYDLILVVANHDDSLGVAGIQYGIEFDDGPGSGVDVDQFLSCSDLDFPRAGFPTVNEGTTQTWVSTNNCQDGIEPFIAGVFRVSVYGADLFRIVPRQIDAKAKVADCNGAESDLTDIVPSRLGFVSFGGTGYNPCAVVVPVEATTWGQVKTLFRD